MYVGIDAHKKYCKSMVMDKKGVKKQKAVFNTTLDGMNSFSQTLDSNAKIVVEASTSGLYVYDYFHEKGFDVIMAHPYQVKAIANAKIKTDDISAEILAHLLRTDLIPEAYVPPLEIRKLRDIVRHRVALTRVQTSIKNRIHAILTKEGVRHGFSDLFGIAGRSFLESVELKEQDRMAVDNFLMILDTLNPRINEISRCIEREAKQKKCKEVEALTTNIKGLGLYTSLLITAEIGDIQRFSHYKKLCSWVGLIPSTHSSGGVTHHGKITKRGNKLMRWSLIQATWRIIRFDDALRDNYIRLQKRIGKQKAIVATARKLVKRIYFILQEVHENQTYELSGKLAPY